MSWWHRLLNPGQFPGLRLGEQYVKDLTAARANPLKKYQLARVCLYYAASPEATDSHLVKELVFQDALRGTALEKQSIVDLIRLVADMSTSKPGVYNMTLLNAVGMGFGTIVSESIPTPTVGATRPRDVSPEAPKRIVLACLSDVAKAARELAAAQKAAALEDRLRSRSRS